MHLRDMFHRWTRRHIVDDAANLWPGTAATVDGDEPSVGEQRLWSAIHDTQSDVDRMARWLHLVGATDPDTPEYAAAVQDWQRARQIHEAIQAQAARDLDALNDEYFALLGGEAK